MINIVHIFNKYTKHIRRSFNIYFYSNLNTLKTEKKNIFTHRKCLNILIHTKRKLVLYSFAGNISQHC